jgi:hypothetical protein
LAWIFFSFFSIAHIFLFGTWNFWEREIMIKWIEYFWWTKNVCCA